MLLLSLKPAPGTPVGLDFGYSILAAISMVCYVTGLFALHWKKPKCQVIFLVFLGLVIVANIVLVLVFQKDENMEYLSVSVFLLFLNCILVYRAIIVYKKMKGKKGLYWLLID